MEAEPSPPKRSLAWRIVQFPLTRLVLALVFVGVGLAGVALIMEGVGRATSLETGDLGFDAIATVLAVLVVHGAYRLYVRLIERRKADEVSLHGATAGLGIGILTGAVLFSCVMAAIWAFGCYRVVGTNPWTAALPMLLIAIFSGYVEEVIARGIVFRILEDGLGTWISLVISAALFGALHAWNPNATAVSSISIASTAGVLLAASYVLTRKLWVAVGIHLAWNFTQGGIFGVAVSGMATEGILVSELDGPELVAGGAFGAEASVFAIVFGVPLGVVMLLMAHRRGRFVRPPWCRP